MGDVNACAVEVLGKAQEGKNPGLAPNACKTPGPPVPVPYPIFGDTGTVGSKADRVNIEDKDVMNMDSTSGGIKGNEGGVAGGDIITNTHAPMMPVAHPIAGPPTVHMAGTSPCCTGSPGGHNHK